MAKLSPGLKLAYASGTITFTCKDVAFINFVLFYYRQVLGLSGTLAGLALLIAMLSDAITDPVMGSFSDKFHSRWGRRHPFMVLGTIPLAACFLFVFRPMDGLSEMQLFVWLTVWSIALRTSLTVFFVPYLALGAELSDDYHERSSITTYRTVLGWVLGLFFFWGIMVFIFEPATGADGQPIDPRLVAENYWEMAICMFVLVIIFGFFSTFFTRKTIPDLPKPAADGERFGLTTIFKDLATALRNPNFRVMFVVMLTAYMILGVFPSVAMHMGTYFWEFTPKEIGTVGLLTITANFFMFWLMHFLGTRFEKHRILQAAFVGFGLNLIWFTGLRLLGVLPENGHWFLLVLYFIYSFTITCCMMAIHIIPPSILADIADENELLTGKRQEGVFFAVQGFSAKSVTGFGLFAGGILLDFVGLDTDATPGEVPWDVLFRLGLIVGPIMGCLFLIPFLATSRFKLTKAKHAETRAALDARKGEAQAEPVSS